MPRNAAPPSYRKRLIRGRHVAVVTLSDSHSGRRRDFWLGDWGSEASRSRYARILAKWEGLGRRLWDRPRYDQLADGGYTVSQVCYEYWLEQQGRRVSGGHLATIKSTIKSFRAQFGDLAAAEVGPNALRDWRASLVREGLTRTAIQRRVAGVLHVYRWAVSREIIEPATLERLRSIEPLRPGEGAPRPPVRPVAAATIYATVAHLQPRVAAMVELQRLTGMRPGEVCAIRSCDVDTTGDVWVYRPIEHKTAHHGHERMIYFGPRAVALLKPWLRTPIDECVFRPIDTYRDSLASRRARRRTPDAHGNRPGTNRVANPRRTPRERYSVDSYRRAIYRASDLADEVARIAAARAGAGDPCESCEGAKCPRCRGTGRVVSVRIITRWHPHQLRHSYATAVRAKFGIEAARILLGHRTIDVTEIYAERDAAAAREIAEKIG